MSSDQTDGGEKFFTVVQAAAYMRVSENTPRNWVNEGRVECEPGPPMLFALSQLRKAKLLFQIGVTDHLRARGIKDDSVIARAVAAGAAKPTDAPEVRYSMEDIDAIAAFSAGGPEPARPLLGSPQVPSAEPIRYKNAVPVEPDEFLVRAGRWAALVDYIKNHGEPSRLPPTFWDTRDCPEFVAPAGVLRFTYWLSGNVEGYRDSAVGPVDGPVTFIRCSAGYVVEDGALQFVPEDLTFDWIDEICFPPGKEAPAYGAENDRWRNLRAAWESAWHLRRRQLRAAGVNLLELPNSASVERRNRLLILDTKYHPEGWGPADLPDWFWDSEVCPPFEPPNDVRQFTYGEQRKNPQTGQPETAIRCTGCYGWMFGDPCVLHYNAGEENFEWVPGLHAAGTMPTKWDEANRRYAAAEHSWNEEWLARGRRRRGE